MTTEELRDIRHFSKTISKKKVQSIRSNMERVNFSMDNYRISRQFWTSTSAEKWLRKYDESFNRDERHRNPLHYNSLTIFSFTFTTTPKRSFRVLSLRRTTAVKYLKKKKKKNSQNRTSTKPKYRPCKITITRNAISLPRVHLFKLSTTIRYWKASVQTPCIAVYTRISQQTSFAIE